MACFFFFHFGIPKPHNTSINTDEHISNLALFASKHWSVRNEKLLFSRFFFLLICFVFSGNFFVKLRCYGMNWNELSFEENTASFILLKDRKKVSILFKVVLQECCWTAFLIAFSWGIRRLIFSENALLKTSKNNN